MSQLLYPIGIQTFSEIREGGYVYVDKTDYIHRLITTGKFYFLSRPRRFGKSLLLSTIESYFQGRRDLFEGLAINNYPQEWTPCPVLHLDFTGRNYNVSESLSARLNSRLEIWEEIYGKEKADRALEERFQYVIMRAWESTGQKVVILIDEYDKPLLETFDKPELQQKFRDTLRGVYGNLKGMDSYIRFAILTGVTKFGQMSIFSDLNNLQDISLDEQYSGICGVTTDELHQYFHLGVEELARDWEITTDEAFEKLKQSYGGYHFSPVNSPEIYNPFSILNCLNSDKLTYDWAQSIPGFVKNIFENSDANKQDFSYCHSYLSSLTCITLDDLKNNPVPILYQGGYLTITDFEPEFNLATLGYPNNEAKDGIMECLRTVNAEIMKQSAQSLS